MEKLLLFLLQGIPESSGQLALSLALLGVPLSWKRIIAAGTMLAIIIFVIRNLPLTFGIHAAVVIFLVVVAVNKATNIPITKIFIAVIVSFVTLVLLELVTMDIFFTLTKMDPGTTIADNNNVLWKLSGLPHAFLLNIFALLVARFKKPREDAWKI